MAPEVKPKVSDVCKSSLLGDAALWMEAQGEASTGWSKAE